MGKCVVSGSRILDPETGTLRTIDEIVERKDGRLVTMDKQYQLTTTSPSAYVNDGVKPVFKVRTTLGREITTTLTHPFLTASGWRPLAEIRVGEHVAVPRTLPYFGQAKVPEGQIKLVAYFISDGGLTGSSPCFTNSDARIRQDFIESLKCFSGVKASIQTSGGTRVPTVRVNGDLHFIRQTRKEFGARLRGLLNSANLSLRAFGTKVGVGAPTVYYWTVGAAVPAAGVIERIGSLFDIDTNELVPEGASAISKNGKNPVTEWLDGLGLWGHGAHTKRVPPIVFQLRREDLALFLNRLFTCDGSVYVQNKDQAAISYCTVNKELAREIQHLLLRFGIIAKLRSRTAPYKKTRRPFFELRITRQEDVRRFIEEIGMFGKEKAAQKALAVSRSKRPKANLDLVPKEVWTLIERKKGTLTWAEISRRLGIFEGANLHVGKRTLGRKHLLEIAQALGDQELEQLATSDLYWDKIESIEYVGDKQVYDLTVPDTHNFVAEDVLVHNTSLAMNIAENAAVGHKVPVAVFSMEMPGTQLAMRMMSSLGRINAHRMRTGKLGDDDWPRLTSAVSLLNEAPIFIDDTAGLTPLELRARARRIKREHGLGMIVIDYLQLMSGSGEENRATEISNMTRALKNMAKELNVPVVALSQLNRSVESRNDKRPVMSDLRESGAIEQDADVILFVYRDEVYREDSPDKGIAEIIIGKQRNGPIGTVRLTFLGEYTKFENYLSAGAGSYDSNF